MDVLVNSTALESKQCLFLTYYMAKPVTLSYVVTVVTCILTGILSVSGVLANSLVCAAIVKNRSLRVHSNILLQALSLNDLMIGLVTEPLYIIRRSLETSEVYLCWLTLAYRTTWNISIGMSFILITLVSCERFLALFFPFRYNQHVTVRKLVCSAALCAGTWMLLPISRFAGLDTRSFYYISSALIVSVIAIIVVSQVKIFKLARHHHVQISLTSVSSAGSELRNKKRTGRLGYSSREAKIARNTAFIVGSVLLCYLPLVGSTMAMILIDGEYVFYYNVFPWTDLLVFTNSLLSPLIYCWRNRELRATMYSMLRCRKAQNHDFDALSGRELSVQYAATSIKETS
ncbi:adrenocorticotropic hormone receptor [Nematostella vectensis]|uniref:adrenocorticotropic hormone receptor n=1 Tax=Nematostella vectensis TaxID=45351 RepID=UPI0020776DE5|nr:adrenocorticotropic hormone receptor [Nematostella vectensis]